MTQSDKKVSSSCIGTMVAIGSLLIAIVALVHQVYQGESDKRALETQNTNLTAQTGLLSQIATATFQEAAVEASRDAVAEQMEGQNKQDSEDFAVTLAAISEESNRVQATRRALEEKLAQLESAQTVVAQSETPRVSVVRADDIIPKISGYDGELQTLMDWWREINPGSDSGLLSPSGAAPGEYCYGMAWNTIDYGYHHLVVFKSPIQLAFADGGWHTTVCIREDIYISVEDVGRIQMDWLGKRYNIDSQPWAMTVKP